MFKLEKGNVVKIVTTEYGRDKLVKKGFKEAPEGKKETKKKAAK